MIKAEDNITLKSSKELYDNAQYFWHTGTGLDTGAHITEIPKADFEDDPANGGGNMLARSNAVIFRDGLDELAKFGASGMQIGKTDEKHIEVTSNAFNVYDEDGSNPFSVSTSTSSTTQPRSKSSSVGAIGTGYYIWTTQEFLKGTIIDNKVYFGVNQAGIPTDYSNYADLPVSPTSYPTTYSTAITINGVKCQARYYQQGVLQVRFENTTNAIRYVGLKYTQTYYDTYIRTDDSTLEVTRTPIALVDITGKSKPHTGCSVYTWGHLATLQIDVYNTSSIAVGGVIYHGTLLEYPPPIAVVLTGNLGRHPIIGSVGADGDIYVFNTGSASITSSASTPIWLTATYIYQ